MLKFLLSRGLMLEVSGLNPLQPLVILLENLILKGLNSESHFS